MVRDFHAKRYDEETNLKLDIFRRYIREWLPVFMTDSSLSPRINAINIFDFFSGPGEDTAGAPGSPVIIVEEIKNYCEAFAKETPKPIHMYFNDIDMKKITRLRSKLNAIQCKKGCCQSELFSLPFAEVFEQLYPRIHQSGSANLVIMDQCGVSDVTPEVVRRLADCACTDVLFFIPSSYIHRFREHPAIASKIDMSDRNTEYNTIHRLVCDYFREQLSGMNYYLAPFSIKSGSSVHGIVFGSGNLYGLEKFLNVCWRVDPRLGEANYNIDRDPSWEGQQFIFAEDNIFRKIDLFERELKEFIKCQKPDNLRMYEFVLQKGFTPSRAGETLKKLQDERWLDVLEIQQNTKARRHAFYLNHKERQPRIRFEKAIGI